MAVFRVKILLLAGVCIFFILGCGKDSPFCVRGRGEHKYDFLSMYAFKSIDLNIDGANVYLSKGRGQQVKVVAKSNVINNINTTVNGDMWKIEYHRCVKQSDSVAIYISLPAIEILEVSANANIYCYDKGLDDLVGVDVSSSNGSIFLRDTTIVN